MNCLQRKKSLSWFLFRCLLTGKVRIVPHLAVVHPNLQTTKKRRKKRKKKRTEWSKTNCVSVWMHRINVNTDRGQCLGYHPMRQANTSGVKIDLCMLLGQINIEVFIHLWLRGHLFSSLRCHFVIENKDWKPIKDHVSLIASSLLT